LQVQLTTDKRERITAWKKRVMSSEKHAHQWARANKSVAAQPMKLPDGRTTADEQEQLSAIADAWLLIFYKFATNPPDPKVFLTQFEQYMRSSPMTIEPMTGALLVNQAKKTKPSSSGLDQWRPESLQALAKWYPSLFNGLASIFRYVERRS
jgi:hypothetical protein